MAIFRRCSEGYRLEIASRKLLIVKFAQTFETGGGIVKDSSCDGRLSSFMNLNRSNAQLFIIIRRESSGFTGMIVTLRGETARRLPELGHGVNFVLRECSF